MLPTSSAPTLSAAPVRRAVAPLPSGPLRAEESAGVRADRTPTGVGLDRQPPGAVVRVLRIAGDDVLARRLADAGFWPGTVVAVVRCAPFGDPVQYALRGFRIALRRNEAARVIVAAEGAA